MEAGEHTLPDWPAPPPPAAAQGTAALAPWPRAAVPGLSVPPVIGACFPELKDLNSSMTTPEMAGEIKELRKDCASYAEKLERIKSAANHVTPEEKEKVKSCQGLRQALAAELRLGLGQLYQTLRQLTRSPVRLIPVQGGCMGLPLPCKPLLWAVICHLVNSSFLVLGVAFRREVHVPAGAL